MSHHIFLLQNRKLAKSGQSQAGIEKIRVSSEQSPSEGSNQGSRQSPVQPKRQVTSLANLQRQKYFQDS